MSTVHTQSVRDTSLYSLKLKLSVAFTVSKQTHSKGSTFSMRCGYVKMFTSMGSADVKCCCSSSMWLESSIVKRCEPLFKVIGRLKVRKSSHRSSMQVSNSNLCMNPFTEGRQSTCAQMKSFIKGQLSIAMCHQVLFQLHNKRIVTCS